MQIKSFVITTLSKLHVYILFLCIVVVLSFVQSTYHIDQHDGPIQLELVISTPSSFDINVRLHSIDGTATAG